VLRRDRGTTRLEATRDKLVETRDKLVVRRTTGETIRLETNQANESNQAEESSASLAVSSEERTNTSLRPTIARDDVYPITVIADWQTLLDGAVAGAPLELDER
jgi:hypothetical protein